MDEYKKSRALMESVTGLFDANPNADETGLWVQAAKEHGFEFSVEELSDAFNERIQNEPSGRVWLWMKASWLRLRAARKRTAASLSGALK